MAQQVGALVTNSDDLSSIPASHTVEEEKRESVLVSCPLTFTLKLWHVPTSNKQRQITNVILKEEKLKYTQEERAWRWKGFLGGKQCLPGPYFETGDYCDAQNGPELLGSNDSPVFWNQWPHMFCTLPSLIFFSVKEYCFVSQDHTNNTFISVAVNKGGRVVCVLPQRLKQGI